MKLLVFLGAGVSVPSGLPTASELTAKLFEPRPGENDETIRVRRLLRLMEEHDSSDIRCVGLYSTPNGFRASGAIYRGKASTYEDLYFLCEQINLWSLGLSDNSQTTSFMKDIESKAGRLLNGASFEARLNDLAILGRPACSFIESVVARTLQRKYLAGLDLLLELALSPAVEELNIATLNHDTLVEQLLSDKGIEYADGFGERDGDVRWSDDRVYDGERARIRLIKMHGAINWYSFKHSGRSRTAVFLGKNLNTARDGANNELIAESASPSFLSGINKIVSYHRGIYADVHFRFLEQLRRCNRILMSGYGWGDPAINFQLDTWLDSFRDNKVVLLHKNSEQLRDRSLIMASGYNGWVRSGRLVVLDQWFADTSILDVNPSLS